MSSDDAHRGGALTEMAEHGTSMPNDAGIQNTIPSVPRPDQRSENRQFDNQGLAEPSLAFAADNATDLPRSTKEMGTTGEVVTGTGDAFPVAGESKRINPDAMDPGARGNARTIKHANLNRSVFDRSAREDGNAGDFIREHEIRNE
ncbi:uncharacterized protein CDV56_102377 [Aspergillus thermomutatus]|uniref:Uncharacterized protein n=1 Tax=Aspergillus thermomutatus TaxID=41047 RepID=A0A397HPR7_ASPTH|nr:uncharacterized protein CDV56_102377 [Aspergillus thermomutatus]RHZ65161.1 hypothetical protein CDV56_102377 [Aspergillus thermomutatus]